MPREPPRQTFTPGLTLHSITLPSSLLRRPHIDAFRSSVHAPQLHGREGVDLIATVGLDMAIWDAFARVANQPLAV